jgi:hypothetical protein
LILNAINNETNNEIITYFGTPHIYSPIIPVTKNIATKAKILVIVANTTPTQTSSTAFKIASLIVSQSFLSLICLEIFSITTVELSTSIHNAKTSANKTILLILSHKI